MDKIIIAWLIIGLGVQLWWTVGVYIRKLDGLSHIKDCFGNFWAGYVFLIGYIITAAINIMLWPVALVSDIIILKRLFEEEEL